MATVIDKAKREGLEARDAQRARSSRRYLGLLTGAAVVTFLLIVGIIGTILIKGLPSINWAFLSDLPREGMTAGGIWPMIRGSLLLMFGTMLVVLPVGVLGGIYMAEYAGESRFVGLIRSSLVSLAATPSIVYGLFGLAVFVLAWKLGTSLMAGWLTLALFSLPVVIITTESAIRAVPESLVEGGLALGLSKGQTIRKIVLPNAASGIATGIVLSTGRAAGEAPPILLTAGIYYSTGQLEMNLETLRKPVANLPYHLAEGYRQGGVIPESIIWGTCVVLMGLVLLINLGAILVRARSRARSLQS